MGLWNTGRDAMCLRTHSLSTLHIMGRETPVDVVSAMGELVEDEQGVDAGLSGE